MTTLREAAQQALEALKDCVKALDALHAPGDSIYTRASDSADRAEIALRAALAQQTQTPCDIAEDGVCEVIDCCRNSTQEEQEPIAPYAWMAVGGTIWLHKTSEDDVPLYTHQPRREWHGLKEWEINDGRDQLPTEDLCGWSFRQGVYFAEKALKERNNG